MAMVCKKCGNKLEEGDNYCIICDKYVDAIDESEYGINKDESQFAVYNKPASTVIEEKKKNVALLTVIIVVSLIAIVGAIYYISTYADKSYAGIVNKYYDSLYKSNNDDYLDVFLNEYYLDNQDSITKKYTSTESEILKGAKYTYEIVSADRQSYTEKDKISAELSVKYDTKIKAKQVYKVEVEVNREFEGVTEKYTENIVAIKVDGGDWYIYFE